MPIADPLRSVAQWRRLFPIVGHVMDLPPPVFFALSPLGCVVAFSETRWSMLVACVWAPWMDGRLVLAVPLALVCRYVFRGV